MGPGERAAAALERTLGRKQARRLRGRVLGRRHLLPDFIIIGAARSGTTHLLGQLNAHPNVLEGPAETHFFDSHRYTYGLGWYRLRFPTNKSRRQVYRTGLHPVLTGESSPSYLAHPNAPARVAATASEMVACPEIMIAGDCRTVSRTSGSRSMRMPSQSESK